LFFWSTGSKTVGDKQLEEVLIADKRAGLTPADIVEQRFRALLHNSSLTIGIPRLCLPRDDSCTRRTIEYASLGDPKAGASQREANLDQGESTIYAISVTE
jgi:hypothetical protein